MATLLTASFVATQTARADSSALIAEADFDDGTYGAASTYRNQAITTTQYHSSPASMLLTSNPAQGAGYASVSMGAAIQVPGTVLAVEFWARFGGSFGANSDDSSIFQFAGRSGVESSQLGVGLRSTDGTTGELYYQETYESTHSLAAIALDNWYHITTSLSQDWQTISISLGDITYGPYQVNTAFTEIMGFNFYQTWPDDGQERRFYLDDLSIYGKATEGWETDDGQRPLTFALDTTACTYTITPVASMNSYLGVSFTRAEWLSDAVAQIMGWAMGNEVQFNKYWNDGYVWTEVDGEYGYVNIYVYFDAAHHLTSVQVQWPTDWAGDYPQLQDRITSIYAISNGLLTGLCNAVMSRDIGVSFSGVESNYYVYLPDYQARYITGWFSAEFLTHIQQGRIDLVSLAIVGASFLTGTPSGMSSSLNPPGYRLAGVKGGVVIDYTGTMSLPLTISARYDASLDPYILEFTDWFRAAVTSLVNAEMNLPYPTVTYIDSTPVKWAPRFTSVMPTAIQAGASYSYTPAINTTGAISVVSKPDWLSWSGSTLSGTPAEPGQYMVSLRASRTGGGTEYQNGTIIVSAAPSTAWPPFWTSSPPLSVAIDGAYSYAPSCNVTASISVVSKPDWLTWDGGTFSGSTAEPGTYSVRISALGPGGGTAYQEWGITVIDPTATEPGGEEPGGEDPGGNGSGGSGDGGIVRERSIAGQLETIVSVMISMFCVSAMLFVVIGTFEKINFRRK